MANQNANHSLAVNEILARCGSRKDCRLWKNAGGVGRGLDHDGVIRFGLRGAADVIGVYQGGLFIAIEVKTGSGRQSKYQRAFELMIKKFGGMYAIVNSADQANKFLDQLGGKDDEKRQDDHVLGIAQGSREEETR